MSSAADPRDNRVSVRFTSSDIQKLAKLAAKDRIPLSTWIYSNVMKLADTSNSA